MLNFKIFCLFFHPYSGEDFGFKKPHLQSSITKSAVLTTSFLFSVTNPNRDERKQSEYIDTQVI